MSVFVVVVAVGLICIAVEWRFAGRDFPAVSHWWRRALLLNAGQAGLLYATGTAWDGWFQAHRLWHADHLGLWGGVVVGYVTHTFVYYWWHRARHASPLLWRFVHQIHHSPQRIEIITAFYKHPIEILINSFLSSTVLYVVVGLSPQQALITMIINGLAELFYHWNIKTPQWIGYIIQRPEMHCIHHEEGRHQNNYGDLPIFDLLFGTFQNPRSFEGRCGFTDQREQLLLPMLRGVDVHTTKSEPST
jgi:sterol desaturase/sphingolipid hydroxylase (fatty acid hydroxylase superfamily)